MAITYQTDMLYTRAGEGTESNVLSAHNALIFLFTDTALVGGPATATVKFNVKNNAGAIIFTSDEFPAYLLDYSDPTAQFRFDATQIIKHIINNYFYREMSNDVISPENYGSLINVDFTTYDNGVQNGNEFLPYFASHALNQIGDEYGANIPRLFYNDTEEIAHFLGFPNHVFFYAPLTLVAETPIIEVLPAIANLITAWTNQVYDTFTSSGSEITSAINTGPGGGIAIIDLFTINAGDFIRVTVNLTLNSGAAPSMRLWDEGGGAVSLAVKLSAGDNTIILQSITTSTVNGTLRIFNASGDATTNFSTDAVDAQKLDSYSEEGTLGLYMHDIDLAVFQLNISTKHLLMKYDPTGPTLVKTYNLTVSQPCDNAVYIRWLTRDGIYMYWAFNPFKISSVEGQKIGNVINSFNEQALANSRNYPIGYNKSFNKIDVSAASVPIVFLRKLMELFISPAVYLWQGEQTPDENLISAFPIDSSYDTIDTDGTVIISAINAAGSAFVWSEQFSVSAGETIVIILDLTLNSGELPLITIDDFNGLGVISNNPSLAAGFNRIELICTASVTTARFRINNTAASNFETNRIIVKHGEVETDWILLEAVEGSHNLREKKGFDNFNASLVLPENFTQTLGGSDL